MGGDAAEADRVAGGLDVAVLVDEVVALAVRGDPDQAVGVADRGAEGGRTLLGLADPVALACGAVAGGVRRDARVVRRPRAAYRIGVRDRRERRASGEGQHDASPGRGHDRPFGQPAAEASPGRGALLAAIHLHHSFGCCGRTTPAS